jgi:assimilatory nitrate reductase catalytic subunit
MPTVATHCPYCALQCGVFFTAGPTGGTVEPNPQFPVNKGGLCVKGWSAASTLHHPDRLRTPLVRTRAGVLTPVSWEIALREIAERFQSIQTTHGYDAVGVFGGGSLTNEKAYLLGKFARAALRTANIDYNGRFCMSSAAAAQNRAFGLDRGLPFPLDDLPRARVILLAGGNPAETMPPIMQYFEAQQRNGGVLIVADPRRTATALWAQQHLRLRPGTDAALANGLLHILIRDGFIDRAFIAERTEGFEEARRVAMSYWPERVEQITGVSEGALTETAHMMGRAPSVMILTARGPEQQAQGVANALAYINIALALGAVGKPDSGFGSLTGQGNGQGGREHGQKADQLPGYRRLEDSGDRRHIARIWNVPESEIPHSGKSAFELLDALGTEIHGLFVMGSNPVVSAPDARRILARLTALDTLVVADFFLSETAQHAHVVLPSAQWVEEQGTMTNLEGRVVFRARACPPPDGVRTDVDILSAVATALGRGGLFPYRTERDVFDELRRATAGASADYAGISYERIDAENGIFWPCPSEAHPGTPRLFADRFPTESGRAHFHATPHQDIADPRDADFPLLLTTGRVLAQYQSGTQTRRTPELQAIAPEAVAEMHPVTATAIGVADGDHVVLATRRGSATFRAKVTRTIRQDTIFAPFHWSGDQSANRLTNAVLDPLSRMPEFKVCRVRADRASRGDAS